MERSITGFHRDDAGDWVAELECGHNQHVRHRPPFQDRAWVMDDAQRAARIGAVLECPLCDRAELPASVRHVRNRAVWDADTMPAGLRRKHRLGPATWGVLHVRQGTLRIDGTEVREGDTRAIPPGVEHRIEPDGEVEFWIEFLAVQSRRAGEGRAGVEYDSGDGGDPACWANLLCPECGAVMDGNPHKDGCPRGE